MARNKNKAVNLTGSFHLVVKANHSTDIEDMLRNHTDWIGEPENAEGLVISMRLLKLEGSSIPKPSKAIVKQSYLENLKNGE